MKMSSVCDKIKFKYENVIKLVILICITDTNTNYLHVYVPDNRYAEPIIIYCYKVNKVQSEVSPFFT